MTKLRDLLKEIYLFKTFTRDELDKIAHIAEKKECLAGNVIFYEGDKAEDFYLIEYGTVRITKKSSEGPKEIGTLSHGMHFGELPFLDGKGRAVTAEALEKVELFVVPYEKLRDVLSKDAKIEADFFREIAHYLVVKLRQAAQDLSTARELKMKYF